jgi:hypothetical protein
MTAAGFDLIDWQAVELAAEGFPEMFHIWASKQMSRFAALDECSRFAVSGTTANVRNANNTMKPPPMF